MSPSPSGAWPRRRAWLLAIGGIVATVGGGWLIARAVGSLVAGAMDVTLVGAESDEARRERLRVERQLGQLRQIALDADLVPVGLSADGGMLHLRPRTPLPEVLPRPAPVRAGPYEFGLDPSRRIVVRDLATGLVTFASPADVRVLSFAVAPDGASVAWYEESEAGADLVVGPAPGRTFAVERIMEGLQRTVRPPVWFADPLGLIVEDQKTLWHAAPGGAMPVLLDVACPCSDPFVGLGDDGAAVFAYVYTAGRSRSIVAGVPRGLTLGRLPSRRSVIREPARPGGQVLSLHPSASQTPPGGWSLAGLTDDGRWLALTYRAGYVAWLDLAAHPFALQGVSDMLDARTTDVHPRAPLLAAAGGMRTVRTFGPEGEVGRGADCIDARWLEGPDGVELGCLTYRGIEVGDARRVERPTRDHGVPRGVSVSGSGRVAWTFSKVTVVDGIAIADGVEPSGLAWSPDDRWLARSGSRPGRRDLIVSDGAQDPRIALRDVTGAWTWVGRDQLLAAADGALHRADPVEEPRVLDAPASVHSVVAGGDRVVILSRHPDRADVLWFGQWGGEAVRWDPGSFMLPLSVGVPLPQRR